MQDAAAALMSMPGAFPMDASSMELGTFVSGQLANKNREEQLKMDMEAHQLELKKARDQLQLQKEKLELDKERRTFEASAKKEELELLEKELKLKEQFKVLEKVRV